ncbi:hypothetical protein MKQ70_23025 [Chitinophaga sedimenti]|uniref:hypothetical protein n=1 Tax=Chitinophaga sedimenti TaxID=2033606 RepID=UPI002006974A|nr:hypothetical protein [Chitinophaga sedimenti]MCK7557722.1 hypothetical protein [Chitinophaga sedimenti]
MYSHLPPEKNLPERFRELDRVVRKEFDSLNKLKSRPDSMLGIYYMWMGPLPRYLKQSAAMDTITPDFKRYANHSLVYADYGSYLIRSHPGDFFRYFLKQNALLSYVPPAEFLSKYNMGADSVPKVVQSFFEYNSPKLRYYSRSFYFVKYTSIFYSVTVTLFVIALLGNVVFKKDGERAMSKWLRLFCIFLLANIFFSIFSAPVVLRYQVSVFIVLVFATILISQHLLIWVSCEMNAEKDISMKQVF